jgi:carboxyl-terminal processing protease
MRSSRSVGLAASVVTISALAGGFFGHNVLVAQDQLSDHYKVLAAALSAIEKTYVGEYASDQLVYSATSGLLQTLDPHSNFMDPKGYAQTRERQEGRYYGIGISILVQDGDLVVANVFEGAPSHQRGLRRGDVISSIEGESTKGWTTEQASGRLKGPRGTTVTVAVRRDGYQGPFDIQIRRDEVHIPTVPAAVMLDDVTGYIKLTEFGENSDQEMGRALRDLTQKGMKRLVFDLRSNPGGALDQAILIANRFLPRGDLIVYTRGRTQNSDQDYRASEPSDYLNLPMVTLVNRSSASASEIVSGALQDHDRSLIVGETTFGKALVQSVYRISQGAGAAITTAKYYTPSGRLIQRPWDGTFDDYLTYTSRDQDANKVHKAEDLKLTDSGRQVYSGGGIDPDRRFDGPIDGFTPSLMSRVIGGRRLFELYAQRFTREGDTRVAPSTTSTPRLLAAGFTVTPEMIAEFKALVRTTPIRFDEATWQRDLPFITMMLQREIDTDLFGLGRAYQNMASRDPQLQYAVSLFGEAQRLLQTSLQTQPRRASR